MLLNIKLVKCVPVYSHYQRLQSVAAAETAALDNAAREELDEATRAVLHARRQEVEQHTAAVASQAANAAALFSTCYTMQSDYLERHMFVSCLECKTSETCCIFH